MSNETDFIKTLNEAGGPLCDDCLAPAAGWTSGSRRTRSDEDWRREEPSRGPEASAWPAAR